MADFCKACSIELFGEYRGDMAGVTSPESWENGEANVTICEGCGLTMVDPEGNCVSRDCMKAGQPGHGDVQWKRGSS